MKKKLNKTDVVSGDVKSPDVNRSKSARNFAPPDNGIHFTVQKRENSTGLPDNLKEGAENLSGIDLSDVKVHYNSKQPMQLNAHAFAQGNQIHVASGQEKHLPHETWHVVQQKQGRVSPTIQLKGEMNINDDSTLEKEADVMGAAASQFKSTEDNVANRMPTEKRTNTSTFQLKDYGEKFAEEKAQILLKLKELRLAGVSSLSGDRFTWHHKFPYSKLSESGEPSVKKLKDARNYIALGPNPDARFDDPSNEGTDFNYKPHGDKSAEDAEPLSPRMSRRLLGAHEEHGFAGIAEGIEETPGLQVEGEARENLDLATVEAEWSQWFIPDNQIDNLINNEALADEKKADLEFALAENKIPLKAKDDVTVKRTAVEAIRAELRRLSHNYVKLELAKKGDKKFVRINYIGVPVTNLSEKNLGALHPILDRILSKKQAWLKRGSMGTATDREQQVLLALRSKRLHPENVARIRSKFDSSEALSLIEATKITPDAQCEVGNVFDRFKLKGKLAELSGKEASSPEELGELATNEKLFTALTEQLTEDIENLQSNGEDLILLKWCAEFMKDEWADETGDAVEGLKGFLEAYEQEKQGIEEAAAAAKSSKPKGGKKQKKAKKPATGPKRGGRKGGKVAEEEDSEPEADEPVSQKPLDISGLLRKKEHVGTAKLFGVENSKEDEDWSLVPELMQSSGNDPKVLPKSVLGELGDEEFTDDSDPWEIQEGAEEEGTYPRTYENYVSTGKGADDYEKFKKQQELADLDLNEHYTAHGLTPNLKGMLALKAHLLDQLIHIPKGKLAEADVQKDLAGRIIAFIKKRLTKSQEKWVTRKKESREKLNEEQLKAKIIDLLHGIEPRKNEHEADFEKRLQDEVNAKLIDYLESGSSPTVSTEDDSESPPKKPGKTSELATFLNDTLPPAPEGQAAQDGASEDVIEHLRGFVDEETGQFNVKLWKDVKGQVLARVNSKTEKLYDRYAVEFAADPKKFDKKKVDKSAAAVAAPRIEVEAAQPQAHLADLITETNNPGGGDCLFYAMNGTSDRDQAQVLRLEIAENTGAISNHELMTLLNETPGLSRFAHRVPAHNAGAEGGVDIPAIYRRVLSAQHTWGGRTEIATFARHRNQRVAVVEIEAGLIESVKVYLAGGGTEREVLHPSDEQLTAAFAGSLILVHRGGNHWLHGTLNEE
jgi:hypothetical protein